MKHSQNERLDRILCMEEEAERQAQLQTEQTKKGRKGKVRPKVEYEGFEFTIQKRIPRYYKYSFIFIGTLLVLMGVYSRNFGVNPGLPMSQDSWIIYDSGIFWIVLILSMGRIWADYNSEMRYYVAERKKGMHFTFGTWLFTVILTIGGMLVFFYVVKIVSYHMIYWETNGHFPFSPNYVDLTKM